MTKLTKAELERLWLDSFDGEAAEREKQLVLSQPDLIPLLQLHFIRGFEAGELRRQEVFNAAFEESENLGSGT